MKKKVTKTKRRVSKPSRATSKTSSFTFQRFIIVTACVLLVVGVFNLKKTSITQSVAGIGIMRGLFQQATVSWERNPLASSYNIYYKEKGDSTFTNSVRNIPANVTSYTISYLKKGATYEYKISAADANGREYDWSVTQPITNLQPM